METWFEIARDNRKAARTLLKQKNCRSAVSRAYYAAYARITWRLAEAGVSMPGGSENPRHKAIPSLILNDHGLSLSEGHRKALSKWFRELYRMRLAADYMPSVAIGEADAVQANSLVEKTFNML